MADKKSLIEKRKDIKKLKPKARRKDTTKKPKLNPNSWRRPRGLQNKQRMNRKSHVKGPATGYGSPKEIRGLHKSGLEPVLVTNVNQLENITKEQGIIISSNLGARKKKGILELANKKGLKILNLDVEKTVKDIDESIKLRKKDRKEKLDKKKEKKTPEKPKKAINKKVEKNQESKEKSTEPNADIAEDEKKKAEKQEKDKVLTKRT